jgi:hypothetical protein
MRRSTVPLQLVSPESGIQNTLAYLTVDYQESLRRIKLLGSTHVYRKMCFLLYRLYIYAEKQLT